MIEIAPALFIDPSEIQLSFVQAAGPGGQNVNKVATAAQLRFDAAHSPSLPDEVRERLIRLAGKRVTQEGILIIHARAHRTQERNRQEAIDRLVALIQQAARRPKRRRKTQPTAEARRKRLEAKRQRSEIKRARRRPRKDEF